MHLKEQERRENLSSLKDRNPYPRLTPPWLQNMSVYESRISRTGENIVPSSFSSSLVSSAAASPPAAPPAAGAAAAPPPDPTFNRRSLTSFPSRACKLNRQHLLPTSCSHRDFVRTLAKREVQIGSTSSILAALMMVCSLSAW